MSNARQTPSAIAPPTLSIAAVCTPTAASASVSEPEAAIPPGGAAPRQSGISIGTSISPEPCAVDTTNDQSASPA